MEIQFWELYSFPTANFKSRKKPKANESGEMHMTTAFQSLLFEKNFSKFCITENTLGK